LSAGKRWPALEGDREREREQKRESGGNAVCKLRLCAFKLFALAHFFATSCHLARTLAISCSPSILFLLFVFRLVFVFSLFTFFAFRAQMQFTFKAMLYIYICVCIYKCASVSVYRQLSTIFSVQPPIQIRKAGTDTHTDTHKCKCTQSINCNFSVLSLFRSLFSIPFSRFCLRLIAACLSTSCLPNIKENKGETERISLKRIS